MKARVYHGKVIVFGEYSVIFGSPALLIPHYSSSAQWDFLNESSDQKSFSSNRSIIKFFRYLNSSKTCSKRLDLNRFRSEIDKGLFLKSDIPFGYGVGSSGSLVAAVYDRYHLDKITDNQELKQFLATMENCFHSSSSGIDPLQCYLGKPFVIKAKNEITILDHKFMPKDVNIFFIDTNIKSSTLPLVNYFKEQRQNKEYLDKFNNIYVPCMENCIDTLIGQKTDVFFKNLTQLSHLQTEMLRPMIPDRVIHLFDVPFDETHFQVKICGSGGGGYLLGFSDNKEITDSYLKAKEYKALWLK